MSYYKLLLQMAQNYVIAANMAINANEPYNASLYYEQLNSLLPDSTAETLLPDDTTEPEDAAAISTSTGYRVDVEALRPARIDRHGARPYLTQSLATDREQWEYLRKLSAAVMESLGRFASDHREFL